MEASTSRAATLELKQLNPKAYIDTFLSEHVRPDGRDFTDWRQTSINTGSLSTADGSALVRLGDTAVLCGVTCQVAEPDLTAPKSGFLVVNVDLPPICSPEFKPGPPSDEAQVISDRIRNIVLSSGIVPLRSLCIEPGRAARVLFIDVVCIAYQGNIVDAAMLAITAALQNTKLPRAKWDADVNQVTEEEGPRMPLKLKQNILSASFSIYDQHILVDPDSFEESTEQARVTVALDQAGSIRHVLQIGLSANAQSLSTCLSLANQRCQELRKLLVSST